MRISVNQKYSYPGKYQIPPFHEKDLNNLDAPADKRLSRELLREFFLTVEKKIKEYDNSLTDDILLEKTENCEWTRFALIMGQHGHLHSHMGMIMGFIIEETGFWPRMCLKNHCTVLTAPLCGILRRNFGDVVPLRSPNCSLSPTNWSVQPGISIFQTRSRVVGMEGEIPKGEYIRFFLRCHPGELDGICLYRKQAAHNRVYV